MFRADRNWTNIYRREFVETSAVHLMSLAISPRLLTVEHWVQSQAGPRRVSSGAQWHCDRFISHDCGCPLSVPTHPRPTLVHSSVTTVTSSETDSLIKPNTKWN